MKTSPDRSIVGPFSGHLRFTLHGKIRDRYRARHHQRRRRRCHRGPQGCIEGAAQRLAARCERDPREHGLRGFARGDQVGGSGQRPWRVFALAERGLCRGRRQERPRHTGATGARSSSRSADRRTTPPATRTRSQRSPTSEPLMTGRLRKPGSCRRQPSILPRCRLQQHKLKRQITGKNCEQKSLQLRHRRRSPEVFSTVGDLPHTGKWSQKRTRS